MDKPLKNKSDKINNLVDDAKDSANLGHDTENQLSNNLISITLAFVALIATAISTSNVLATISLKQKIVIMISIILFCMSIFVGLTNYYLNMRAHQKAAKSSHQKALKVKEGDLSGTSRNAIAIQNAPNKRNNFMILLQITLLAIGLIFCVTFVGLMLFITSKTV